MSDLMIDLETLGLRNDCVITQIGVAEFELTDTDVYSHLCQEWHLNVEDQLNKKRRFDWSTMQWWLKQDENARMRLANPPPPITLENALINLHSMIEWQRIQRVWSHGANFDIAILEGAFRSLGMESPWRYYATRDTRTIFWLAGDMKVVPALVKHSAVHDAAAQARTVQMAWQKLQGNISNANG